MKKRTKPKRVKPVEQVEEFNPDEFIENERKKSVEEAKKQELVNAVKEHSFRRFLAEQIQHNVMPMPVQKQPPKVVNKKAIQRYPHLLLTDWHFEEVVKAESVMGLNSYDIPTACRRAWRVVREVIEWKRDMEFGGRYAFPELTVALNGDFLTGTLHGLEKHSSAPNVVRATLACADLIALALADLAAEFKKVRVVGVVGNHGRLPDSKKVPTKDPTRSWDFMAYSVAKRRLESHVNVEWHLPEAYGVIYDVGGHATYQAHGNFIPQSLGIIGYGIRRFVSMLASNLSAAGKPLKYAFFGHWHQSNSAEFAGVTTFVGPSLIGTQEYGFLQNGSIGKSAQLLTLFDPDMGYVSSQPFYGEGPGKQGTYAIAV